MLLKRFLLTTSVVILVGGVGLAAVPSAKAQMYVSVNAGGTILNDADITDTAAIGSITGEAGFDTGFGVSGAVGYAYGAFRFEGEISYRKNDLDDLQVNSLTLGGTTISGALGTFALEGDTTALYLADQLASQEVAVTRLARGLPAGSQLDYANSAVLADAIQGRQPIDREH